MVKFWFVDRQPTPKSSSFNAIEQLVHDPDPNKHAVVFTSTIEPKKFTS
jgi:hypothetical protein